VLRSFSVNFWPRLAHKASLIPRRLQHAILFCVLHSSAMCCKLVLVAVLASKLLIESFADSITASARHL
jgi:hypothetical protein